jgi:hypothetical protein
MPVHARERPNRSLPIRPTLVGICTVPLVSLMPLWTFAAYGSIVNATHAHSYRDITPQVAPALTGSSSGATLKLVPALASTFRSGS